MAVQMQVVDAYEMAGDVTGGVTEGPRAHEQMILVMGPSGLTNLN
jgi:hypothetical protein